MLSAEGVPTAHGGRQWWPSTVRAVLVRSSSPETAAADPRGLGEADSSELLSRRRRREE